MKNRALKAIAVFFTLTVLRPVAAAAGEYPVNQPKRVLVELFTSQGCSSCAPASDLLGKLTEPGVDRDRIVPLNLHVDYFNQPWPDPYSDASYTRRQCDYNGVQRRDDLRITPLLMVDGRQPFFGSDRTMAVAAIEQALKMPPEVALDLKLDGMGNRKTALVKVAARSPEVAGRALLIGMALTEDPVKTRVRRGENVGLMLVEHHVVRRLDQRFLKLDRTGTRAVWFLIELPGGADAARFRVVVFAQDRVNGQVFQAEELPWNPGKAPADLADNARDLDRVIARRKARRAALNRHLNLLVIDTWGITTDEFLEDTVQETLLKVLDRLDTFAGRGRFISWAMAIAVRVALTTIREQRWQRVSLDQFREGSSRPVVDLADQSLGPERASLRSELLAAMHTVISEQLTGKQWLALTAELNGMPQDEIARQLGSNRNAVYKLTHDARIKIRAGLEAAGFGPENWLDAWES